MTGQQLTVVPSTHAASHRAKSAHGRVTAEHLWSSKHTQETFFFFFFTPELSLSGTACLLCKFRRPESQSWPETHQGCSFFIWIVRVDVTECVFFLWKLWLSLQYFSYTFWCCVVFNCTLLCVSVVGDGDPKRNLKVIRLQQKSSSYQVIFACNLSYLKSLMFLRTSETICQCSENIFSLPFPNGNQCFKYFLKLSFIFLYSSLLSPFKTQSLETS